MMIKLFACLILILPQVIVAHKTATNVQEKNFQNGDFLPFHVQSQDSNENSDYNYSEDDKLSSDSKDTNSQHEALHSKNKGQYFFISVHNSNDDNGVNEDNSLSLEDSDEHDSRSLSNFHGTSLMLLKMPLIEYSQTKYEYDNFASRTARQELLQIRIGVKKIKDLIKKYRDLELPISQISSREAFKILLKEARGLLHDAEKVKKSEEKRIKGPSKTLKLAKKIFTKVKKVASHPKKMIAKIKTSISRGEKAKIPQEQSRQMSTETDFDQKVWQLCSRYDAIRNRYRSLTTIRMQKPIQIWSKEDTRTPVLYDNADEWAFMVANDNPMEPDFSKSHGWKSLISVYSLTIKEMRPIEPLSSFQEINDKILNLRGQANQYMRKLSQLQTQNFKYNDANTNILIKQLNVVVSNYFHLMNENSRLITDKTVPSLIYSIDGRSQQVTNTDMWKPLIVTSVEEWRFVRSGKVLNAVSVLQMPSSPEMLGGVSLLLQGIQMINNLNVDHEINQKIMIFKRKGFQLYGKLQEAVDENFAEKKISLLKLKIRSVLAKYITLMISNREMFAKINHCSMSFQMERPLLPLSTLDAFKPVNVITDDEKAFAAKEDILEISSIVKQKNWSELIGGLSLLTRSIQTIDSLRWNCDVNEVIYTLQLKARKLIVSLEEQRGQKSSRFRSYDSKVYEKIQDIDNVISEYNSVLIDARNKEVNDDKTN